MGIHSDYRNVYKTPIIGRLDCTSSAESLSDAALIHTYIRAEKAVAAVSGRTPPSIARAVLTSVWETPRIGFHREAQKSFSAEAEFRNKLLWAPWSIEAAEHWNKTRKVKGLVLEHVTPIDWMWRKLKELDDKFEDPTSDLHPDSKWGGTSQTWEDHAAAYLIRHWTVAIVTEEQAGAIDAYGGRTVGFEPNPFERYLRAEEKMDRVRKSGIANPPPFSTAKFIISGHANDMNI